MMRSFTLKNLIAVVALAATGGFIAIPSAHAQKKPKVIKAKPEPAAKEKKDDQPSVEPDKLLYDKALEAVKKRRFIEARLDYQTLVNTYPDSEYLAKAKLGVADSYYHEGGTSNMVQAIAEYKDFITFFPSLDESAYAQMQVAMGHYKMMEKADRDRVEAESAEIEFQSFLKMYPESPLKPKAEQNLREVQEVLADADYRVGRFYYLKGDYQASAARLMEVSERYPLYSQSDQALFMLGDVYLRAKQFSKNEDDQNHWADLAASCYGRIVREYPLSPLAAVAKTKLTSIGMSVPPPDPDATARMKQQQLYESQHKSGKTTTALMMPMGMLKSAPDTSHAARAGAPNLNPPDTVISATDVLKQKAAGPNFNLSAAPVVDPNAPAETVVPVEAHSGEETPTTGVGAEIISAPSSTAAADSQTPAQSAPSTTAAPGLPQTPTDSSTVSGSSTGANSTDGSTPDSTASQQQQAAPKADTSQESTSKKKKGLKKVIPF